MAHAYTLTALFESRSAAERAVDKLLAAGFSRHAVRLVPGFEEDRDHEPGDRASPRRGDPDGPGLFGPLASLFLPDEDRAAYGEGLRRGGFLVSVEADEAGHDRARDILDDEGTIDMDEREDAWRAEGWSAARGGPERAGRRDDGRQDIRQESRQALADASGEIGSTAIGAAASTTTGLTTGGVPLGSSAAATGSVTPATMGGSLGLQDPPSAADPLAAREGYFIGRRDRDRSRARVRSYALERRPEEER
jgi:hypothetical protein